MAKEESKKEGERLFKISGSMEYCKRIKEAITGELAELKRDYESGVIDKKEYLLYLNRKIDGKTKNEWVDLCNRYIKEREITRGEAREFSRNIESCKRTKEAITKELAELKEDYEKGAISKGEYLLYLNRRIDGKSKNEWLDSCDRYIEEKGEVVEQYKKDFRVNIYYNVRPLLPVAVVLLIILLFGILLLFRIPPIGLAPTIPEVITIRESYNYTDEVNLSLNGSGEYIWLIGNYGSLKSVRLDGTLSKEGSAKVYLEYDDEEYLIFDSSRLKKSDVINYDSLEEGNKEISDVIGEGEPLIDNSINKKIKITTQGGGSKDVGDVFEFNVDGEFSWDVDYDKLCTKWDVNSEPVACYGNEECCNEFVGLGDSGKWNDSFYLSYGRYGSGLENVVSARIVYYDVNLSVPYSDIVLSDVLSLRADFEEVIRFEDVCVETCLLDGFKMLF
jgi:hypothetical protein